MHKKILILSGSPRKHGNSDLLCDEFRRGAIESGHTVEKVFLQSKTIGYCRACYYCKNHDGICAIKDDMADLLKAMNAADVVVMASPVYFYSINAQMKAFIDRCVAQWLTIQNKTFYYIMTAAENTDTVMDCTLECFRGLAKCLKGSVEGGVIYGKGVYEAGSIKDKPAMRQAYEMGRNI
ncbi:MAG: flavodoxin family protein [Desulfovibrio sp.]|nr:flavodoxin family protein [Desulfovibrio sp.]